MRTSSRPSVCRARPTFSLDVRIRVARKSLSQVSAHHPEATLRRIEGKATADREGLHDLVRAEGLLVEHAGPVHGGRERSAAELAPVVAQDRLDLHRVFLEEGQYVVVQDLDGGHGQPRGVGPGPHVAAEAVQHRLDVDLAHPLQRAREEGVHGHEFARLLHLDVTLPVLGIEALQRQDLLLGELEVALTDRLLQPEQPLVPRLEAVADPHPANAARAHLHAAEHQLVGHPLCPVRRVRQGVDQDRRLHHRVPYSCQRLARLRVANVLWNAHVAGLTFHRHVVGLRRQQPDAALRR